MTTTIVNLLGHRGDPTHDPDLTPDVVYVGCRQYWGPGRILPGHPLGNPPARTKRLGLYESLRAYAGELLADPDRIAAAKALHGKTLGCWCLGQRPACHAQIIAAVADGRPDLIPAILEAARHDNAVVTRPVVADRGNA